MNIPHELSYLYEIGQEHLLQEWSKWPYILQKEFVKQAEQYTIALFQQQRATLACNNKYVFPLKMPNSSIADRTNTMYNAGKSLLRKNTVGLILLSGGQGSRLGFSGPKGCMPLSRLQRRTLFSIVFAKCTELQKRLAIQLPIAIMTSPSNHFSILKYLQKHNFFSLLPEQITIFQQKSIPLLDAEMNWYIQSPGVIGVGPGGNGAAFSNGKPILQQWKREGIEWVQIIPIDNPLSTPFDPYLVGCHVSNQSDLVIPTIKREECITDVGVIGENNGKIYVQEYMNSELQSDLSLIYLGMFSCHIDLALQWENSFPWHYVKKRGMRYYIDGEQQSQEIWKFEKFLFDIFPLSNRCSFLMDQREDCFAPIKSMYGKYNIDMAQNSFLQWEQKKFLEPQSNP